MLADVYLMILGGSFLLVSVGRLVQFSSERTDIWWTPPGMAVPLNDSHDRVEVYVAGSRLEDEVGAGHVLLSKDSGATPLTADRVSFRFNNRDRVRAMRIPGIAGTAASGGAAGVLFIMGLAGWLRGARRQAA
jgi:hypothetical protein